MDSIDNLVDAIEDGKIVQVSEHYAKREGLPILRKSRTEILKQAAAELSLKKRKSDEEKIRLDFERPLNWRQSQVISELIDNFHWHIARERRKRGITRKQFALLLNEKELHIRMIECGMLPSNDFVLINKIQETLGINLRKDKKDFTKSAHEILKQQNENAQSANEDEIEIFDDEF